MSLIGETKLNLLLALREEPSYGYQLQKDLNLNQGTIYVHLQELEESGVIEVASEDEDRTYYRLTENGKLLLQALGELDEDL